MEILSFLLLVYAVTVIIRRAWYPEEYEPLMGWRGCLLLLLGLLVAVLILALIFEPL